METKDKRKWTSTELQFLRDNYTKLTIPEIAEKLGRSTSSVTGQKCRLALRLNDEQKQLRTGKKPWTPGEDSYLATNYKRKTTAQLAKHLGRGEPAIRKRAGVLGVSNTYTKWTPEKEEYLKEYWGQVKLCTIVKNTEMTESQIRSKVRQLDLGDERLACGTVYTLQDISTICGVPIRTLYYKIGSGELKADSKVRGTRRYYTVKEKDFIDFVTEEGICNLANCDEYILQGILSNGYFMSEDNILIREGSYDLKARIRRDRAKKSNKPVRYNRPWTTHEFTRLHNLLAEGYRHTEIAKIMHRPLWGVRGNIRKLGESDVKSCRTKV